MGKKLLEFASSISDIKQINPLFSTCKIRVMYAGRNRNMTIIEKNAVEQALPSIIGVPIVGEFSFENEDFKTHGGRVDLDSYKYIHTTKPYGFVPESAEFEWEEVKGSDGSTREYLAVTGCYLWTGRYEEAYTIIQHGKGQSMEIEVTDGDWDEAQDAYRINSFNFSALCVLGDSVEPAFEDASITAYSLTDKESFKSEFNEMLRELKYSLSNEQGVDSMLEKLLQKYGITVEDLDAKGIDYKNLSDEELETAVDKAFGDVKKDPTDTGADASTPAVADAGEGDNDADASRETPNDKVDAEQTRIDNEENKGDNGPKDNGEEPNESLIGINDDYKPADQKEPVKQDGEPVDEDKEPDVKLPPIDNPPPTDTDPNDSPDGDDEINNNPDVDKQEYVKKSEYDAVMEELVRLRAFKQQVGQKDHEEKAQALFDKFELTAEDVDGIDVKEFTLEQLEEKCYAILGRKAAKNYAKKDKADGIKIKLGSKDKEAPTTDRYGDLFERFAD